MRSKRDGAAGFHFEGFDSPNTTPVPDVLFDLLAPNLTEAELRVLLYIIRRTFGFKKNSDNISLKQLVEGITKKDGTVQDLGAGIAKSAASRAIKGLIEKGIITAQRNRSQEKGDEPTTYHLRFKHEDLIPPTTNGQDQAPVYSLRTRGGPPREQDRVLQKNTQETVIQETDESPSKFERLHDEQFSDARASRARAQIPPEGTETIRDALESAPGPSMPSPGVMPPTGPENVPQGLSPQPAGSPDFHAARAAIRAALADQQRRNETGGRRSRRAEGRPSSPPAAGAPGTMPPAALAAPSPRRRGQAVGTTAERELVGAFLGDFNAELLHDDAALPALITQAIHIFQAGAIPREEWPDYLYQARSLVKERAGAITKVSTRDGERKNRGPYYFAVLRDLVAAGDAEERAGP